MSFEALRSRLPVLPSGDPPATPWPRVGRGGVSFSDDLARPEGGRLGVRVRVTDRDDGGYLVDLRDSDPPGNGGRFGLSRTETLTACLLALGHALDQAPSRAWSERVELLLDHDTWIGHDGHTADPAAIALGMARTGDALLGALANAWPDRVGAGSCSLGAVVELRDGENVLLTEVLPGGEGGRPDRAGGDAWAGLVVPTSWPSPPTLDGITTESLLADDSGGVGKHPGGRGVVRRYRCERSLTAHVAFDRVDNPPHGIDRAGPPVGSLVRVHPTNGEPPRAVTPWERVELPAGSCLEVQTCGGAGWGFPGYGDIEWDPGDWFGSKPKSSD